MSSEFRHEGVAINHSPKIIKNRARCKKCNTIIESIHRHDFVRCQCGACAVDGGKEYLRRVAANWDDMEELSITDPPQPWQLGVDKPEEPE